MLALSKELSPTLGRDHHLLSSTLLPAPQSMVMPGQQSWAQREQSRWHEDVSHEEAQHIYSCVCGCVSVGSYAVRCKSGREEETEAREFVGVIWINFRFLGKKHSAIFLN